MLSPSPQEWLARYASHGDEAAFSALVRTQSPLVWRTAMRRLGDAQLAEEAVQNVFLALARKSASLASRPGLSAWLHRAAMLEASALARSRSRREKRHRLLSLQSCGHASDARDDHPAGAGDLPGGADSANAEDAGAAYAFPSVPSAADSAVGLFLDEALSRLPETDRALLLGRYFEERGYEELGAALGKTGAAVKKRTQRALEKVAAHLRRRGVVLPVGGLASLAAAEFSPAAVLASPAFGAPPPFSFPSAASGADLAAGTTSALSWPHRLFFLMSTSKATLTTAAVLLLLLGISGWQSGANASLRQEIQSRRAALEKQTEAEAAARARSNAARSDKSPAAALAAQPLPDPIDGMTLVRLYAYSRAGEALLFDPIPPNWNQDMDHYYQRAGTTEILRLIDEASKAPVAQSLRLKIMRDLITYRLPGHDPALAVRMAVENDVGGEQLAGLMRQLADKDPGDAEKLLLELRATGSPARSRSSRNDPAGELMAGFGPFFASHADPQKWREMPPDLLAFADRHLGSGLISALIFGSGDNPQGSPVINALTFNPGPALDLAARVTDAGDRERLFSGLGRIYMTMQPDLINPVPGGGMFIENGVLRMPTNPDPDHPENTSIAIPNVLEDPRFPAALRDAAIQDGALHNAANHNVWSALAAVREVSAPASRSENLARAAERLVSIPARRQDFDKTPETTDAAGRRLLDQTLAETARALTARQNPDLARSLAEKISDPQLRSQTVSAATP
ncbi:MAG: RNA polymerase sigma factor [Verrucomicrobiota bacterium]